MRASSLVWRRTTLRAVRKNFLGWQTGLAWSAILLVGTNPFCNCFQVWSPLFVEMRHSIEELTCCFRRPETAITRKATH